MGLDSITMSQRELQRLPVIEAVQARRITQVEAAGCLGLSERQIRRLQTRVRQAGPQGLTHRGRGRPSNHRYPAALRRRVLAVMRERYTDFGPTLACEKLAALHRIQLSDETLRQWMRHAGMAAGCRRPRPHRQWRERKACWGEMVQMDGSHHAWLEGRGPRLVLMGYIDDATNRVYARFYDYEGTLPALDSFARYARRYGLPQSVYVDRHTTYRSPGKRTLEDELAGLARPQSQFERALSELGVRVIPAYSPQAKGRIERLFGTFQDRVVKELRLAQVTTREAANRFLARYLPAYNRRFKRLPLQAADLHRPLPARQVWQRILAIREQHALRNDNTVQHETKTYLLRESWNGHRPTTIQAERRLNGKLYLLDEERVLRYREVQERPLALPPPHARPSGSQRRRTPAPDHPWRQFERVQRLKAFKNRTVLSWQNPDISILA
jgi:hypothetical protein